MTRETLKIREILPHDNKAVAQIIRDVLTEMGAPKVGTAYKDKATDSMFENYQNVKGSYFVIEEDKKIIGGAGYAQLDNFKGNVCELQKMYFLPEARGRGLGSKLIKLCLDEAKKTGFDQCYLETMVYMKSAQALYLKNGFRNLDKPLGNTGHHACPVWMLKNL